MSTIPTIQYLPSSIILHNNAPARFIVTKHRRKPIKTAIKSIKMCQLFFASVVRWLPTWAATFSLFYDIEILTISRGIDKLANPSASSSCWDAPPNIEETQIGTIAISSMNEWIELNQLISIVGVAFISHFQFHSIFISVQWKWILFRKSLCVAIFRYFYRFPFLFSSWQLSFFQIYFVKSFTFITNNIIHYSRLIRPVQILLIPAILDFRFHKIY